MTTPLPISASKQATRTPRRILFFYQGRMANISGSVYRGLRESFGQAEVRAIDVNQLLKQRPWLIAANLLAAGTTYGTDLLGRRRDLDDAFFSTGYIFRVIRKLAQDAHKQWPADLSFQMWSMFDFSAPGTPHFIYTDHTYSCCRDYPSYGKAIWAPVRRNSLIERERGIFRNAAAVFPWSRRVARSLISDYGLPEQRVECAGVAPNTSLDRLLAIPTTLDRYRQKRILFVGFEWARKGGQLLAEAFKLVRQRHPDARLSVIGCRPDLRDEGIDIVGPAHLDDLPAHYAQASVFCMPTLMEPFGITFLEGMGAGLPVVALALGAAPDFVLPGKTGCLAEPGDVRGLADALSGLLARPEQCQSLGVQGRELVKTQYTWGSVFGKIRGKVAEVLEATMAPELKRIHPAQRELQ